MDVFKRPRAAIAAALAGVLLLTVAGAAHAAAQPGVLEASVKSFAYGRNQVTLVFPRPVGVKTLAVTDDASLAVLAHAQAGDVAQVEVDDVTAPTKLIKVDQVTRWLGKWPRVLTFAVVAGLLLLVAAAVTGFRPQRLLLGKDNRYSNSQVQLAMWFGAVALVYASAVWLRFEWLGADFIGGVGLTDKLIALTGLSAFTFGGAKVITMQKVANAAAGAAPAPALAPAPTPVPAKTAAVKPNPLADLFQNDQGDADLGDVQMILITVAAVVIFVAASFHFLGKLALASPITLPDVDTALLASFGIGQGAYLFKKAALPLGQG